MGGNGVFWRCFVSFARNNGLFRSLMRHKIPPSGREVGARSIRVTPPRDVRREADGGRWVQWSKGDESPSSGGPVGDTTTPTRWRSSSPSSRLDVPTFPNLERRLDHERVESVIVHGEERLDAAPQSTVPLRLRDARLIPLVGGLIHLHEGSHILLR